MRILLQALGNPTRDVRSFLDIQALGDKELADFVFTTLFEGNGDGDEFEDDLDSASDDEEEAQEAALDSESADLFPRLMDLVYYFFI